MKKRTYLQRRGDAKKRFKTEGIICKYLIKNNPHCFIQPIETVTATGVPDMFVSMPTDICIWVELKNIKRDIAKVVSPDWRPGQISWAERYKKRGGKWLLIIQVNDKLYFTSVSKEKYDLSELFEFNSFNSDIADYLYDY